MVDLSVKGSSCRQANSLTTVILVLVLVHSQEDFIWSKVLVQRWGQFCLLITQEVFLRGMVAPGTRTFVCPLKCGFCLLLFFLKKHFIRPTRIRNSHIFDHRSRTPLPPFSISSCLRPFSPVNNNNNNIFGLNTSI